MRTEISNLTCLESKAGKKPLKTRNPEASKPRIQESKVAKQKSKAGKTKNQRAEEPKKPRSQEFGVETMGP